MSQSRCIALVVDYDAQAAEALRQRIETLGCITVSVTDPRQALAVALLVQPRIAFVDRTMHEVEPSLRRHFGEDALKVVIFDGERSTLDRDALSRLLSPFLG